MSVKALLVVRPLMDKTIGKVKSKSFKFVRGEVLRGIILDMDLSLEAGEELEQCKIYWI